MADRVELDGELVALFCSHDRRRVVAEVFLVLDVITAVLMHLMMSAFRIEQIQQRCCRLYQAAWTAVGSKARSWRKLRSRFEPCLIPDWEALYRSIIAPPQLPLAPDTSQTPAVTERARHFPLGNLTAQRDQDAEQRRGARHASRLRIGPRTGWDRPSAYTAGTAEMSGA